MPGIADLLAEALRQRTGKRVFGTPFYQDELRKRGAAAEMDTLEQQKAQFGLKSAQEKLPLELEALEALAGQREATAGLTGARTITEEGRPELQKQAAELAQLKFDLAKEMDPLKRMEIEARIRLMGAQADKAARPPAAPGSHGPAPGTLQVVETPTGEQVVVDKLTGHTKPILAPDGAPLKKKPPAGEQEKRAKTQNLLVRLGKLEALAKGKAGQSIGPIKGPLIGATRHIIPQSPEVNEMFRLADVVAEEILRANTGAAVSPGEFPRIRTTAPDPRGDFGKFQVDMRSLREELEDLLAARQGQPIGPAAAPKGKSRFVVEVVE